MKNTTSSSLKKLHSIILLLGGFCGSILGLVLEKEWRSLPLGDILNLLFTAIIPLVFFTIASSIASLERLKS
jgi:Na+/H+-dicarboxylate symporter